MRRRGLGVPLLHATSVGAFAFNHPPDDRKTKLVGERGFEPPAPASRRRISSSHQRARAIVVSEQNGLKSRMLRPILVEKVQNEPQPLSSANPFSFSSSSSMRS